MRCTGFWRKLASGEERGAAARLLGAVLAIPAAPYGLVVRLRALAYSRGLFTVRNLDRPVISVGNLTVGGTGKTPMVAYLARRLMARGKRVAVISRGYGGSLEGETRIVSDGRTIVLSAAEAGDEPVHLATSVPGLMTVIGADRYAAGLLALKQLNPDVFILDDGYQHLRLHRDLNILLMDCNRPLGNGRTLPAGLLREPQTAIGRADLVVYTRCTGGEAPAVHGMIPSCRAGHALTGAALLPDGEVQPLAALRGLRGVAFAGIAEPEVFFEALRREGLNVVATIPFADHASYGEREVSMLREAAAGSDCLITTGKDGVKLSAHLARLLPVYATVLEMRPLDPAPLEAALDKVL